MSSPSSPDRPRSSSWQARLEGHCRSTQAPLPVFNIVSDRRGGRTAWSSTVTIPIANSSSQQVVQARYWYDGQYVHNAKEDAAEVALRILMEGSPTSPSTGAGGGSISSVGWNRDAGVVSQASPAPQNGKAVGVGAAWPRSPPTGRW